jgi:hypothetical protein
VIDFAQRLEDANALVWTPDTIVWQPDDPPGAKDAVLDGNRDRPDELFARGCSERC